MEIQEQRLKEQEEAKEQARKEAEREAKREQARRAAANKGSGSVRISADSFSRGGGIR